MPMRKQRQIPAERMANGPLNSFATQHLRSPIGAVAGPSFLHEIFTSLLQFESAQLTMTLVPGLSPARHVSA
jgi:hypothetical protein